MDFGFRASCSILWSTTNTPFILKCPFLALPPCFAVQWELNVRGSYPPDHAVLPQVPLCLHVKWYWGACSDSLVSFHSQDPRLEAVRRTDMRTFGDCPGVCLHPCYFQCTTAYMSLEGFCSHTVMDGLTSVLTDHLLAISRKTHWAACVKCEAVFFHSFLEIQDFLSLKSVTICGVRYRERLIDSQTRSHPGTCVTGVSGPCYNYWKKLALFTGKSYFWMLAYQLQLFQSFL